MIEGYKCACVQTLLLCVLTWKRTREGTEKENDTGRQGCKSKTRTRGRTERGGGAVWVRWLLDEGLRAVTFNIWYLHSVCLMTCANISY